MQRRAPENFREWVRDEGLRNEWYTEPEMPEMNPPR